MPPNNIHETAIVEPPTPLQRPQEVLKRYEPDIKDIVDFVAKVRDRMPQENKPDSSAQAAALQRLGDFVRNMEVLMKTLQGRTMGKGIPVNAEHLEAHIRANILPLKQQIEAMRKAIVLTPTTSAKVTKSPSSVADNAASASVSASISSQPAASRRSKRIRLAKNSKYCKTTTDSSEDEAPTPPPIPSLTTDKGSSSRAAEPAAQSAKPNSRSRASRSSRAGGGKNAKGNGSYYAELVNASVTSKYMCTACNTSYRGESTFNPWWNIQAQKCPHCTVAQVPRIDILDPDNDYCRIAQSREFAVERKRRKLEPEPEPPAPVRLPEKRARCQVAAKVETETCQRCSLDEGEASRLLVLMQHARLCQGRHSDARTREVCMSAKFLMLHLRDCPGVDANKQPCPFRWCRMGTELLRHLRGCDGRATCGVCHPTDLPKSLLELQYLNHYTEELVFPGGDRPSSVASEKVEAAEDDFSDLLEGEEFESQDGDPEDDGLYVGAEEVEDLANFPELQDFLFEMA